MRKTITYLPRQHLHPQRQFHIHNRHPKCHLKLQLIIVLRINKIQGQRERVLKTDCEEVLKTDCKGGIEMFLAWPRRISLQKSSESDISQESFQYLFVQL